MNPITRIAPVTDEEAARLPRQDTLSDLARQITATPVAASARHGRRRLLLGVPLAAGLAAAVVVVTGGGLGVDHSSTVRPADNTAYVVQHVDSALDAAQPGAIAQMAVTTATPHATTTAQEWSYGDEWRAVTYSSSGRVRFDDGYSAASIYTLVNYQAGTWARQTGLGRPAALAPGERDCGSMVGAFPLLLQPGLPVGGPHPGWQPSTVARELRTAISCGTLTVAGRESAGTIELASRPHSVISETIWVNPSSYLPVRVAVRTVLGDLVQRQTANITWLAPTAQNLARLTVPVPAGFREVPVAAAAAALMSHIPG
jgi:hypothetical protein